MFETVLYSSHWKIIPFSTIPNISLDLVLFFDAIRSMNATHRKTLTAVFTEPVSTSLEWRRIEALLVAIGCRMIEGNGSRVDIVQVLTQQADYQTARKYWNKLKERLGKEGSESETNCHRLKLPATDGKNYLTDVATAETLLRLVQSVPSPKAEPIKPWLAKVGYERMQEMADPALSLERARETWRKHGRREK